ncbi:unnamed protein product, partial [Rotaria sp. Silwood2]
TPASPYTKSCKTIRSLLTFIFMLLLVYFILLSLTIVEVLPFYDRNNSETIFDESNQAKQQQFLVISKDHHNCFYCVNNFTTFQEITDSLEIEKKNLKILNELQYIRCLFNILNMVNLIVIFTVYGGPKFITAMTLAATSLIFGSIYIQSQVYMLLFDSSIIVLSLAVVFKCVHTLII